LRCGERCVTIFWRRCRVQVPFRIRKARPTASKIEHLMGQFQGRKPVKPTASSGFMERAMGIEPTSEAWEAPILPLNYARSLFPILPRNLLSVQRFQSLTRLHAVTAVLVLARHAVFEQTSGLLSTIKLATSLHISAFERSRRVQYSTPHAAWSDPNLD
jgi:hypothetical protein